MKWKTFNEEKNPLVLGGVKGEPIKQINDMMIRQFFQAKRQNEEKKSKNLTKKVKLIKLKIIYKINKFNKNNKMKQDKTRKPMMILKIKAAKPTKSYDMINNMKIMHGHNL